MWALGIKPRSTARTTHAFTDWAIPAVSQLCLDVLFIFIYFPLLLFVMVPIRWLCLQVLNSFSFWWSWLFIWPIELFISKISLLIPFRNPYLFIEHPPHTWTAFLTDSVVFPYFLGSPSGRWTTSCAWQHTLFSIEPSQPAHWAHTPHFSFRLRNMEPPSPEGLLFRISLWLDFAHHMSLFPFAKPPYYCAALSWAPSGLITRVSGSPSSSELECLSITCISGKLFPAYFHSYM